MVTITKPNFVQPKTKILAEDINKIIQGLIDTENYLNSLQITEKYQIEYGKVENISTSRVGHYTFNVTFSKSFEKIPVVMFSIENLNPDVDLNIWVSNLTKNGFTLNVRVIRMKTNSYCNVMWLALA